MAAWLPPVLPSPHSLRPLPPSHSHPPPSIPPKSKSRSQISPSGGPSPLRRRRKVLCRTNLRSPAQVTMAYSRSCFRRASGHRNRSFAIRLLGTAYWCKDLRAVSSLVNSILDPCLLGTRSLARWCSRDAWLFLIRMTRSFSSLFPIASNVSFVIQLDSFLGSLA